MTLPTNQSASGTPSRVRRLLESRRAVLVATLLAVALTAPAVATTLQTEDWVQRALVLSGDYHFPDKVNLYGHHGPWSAESVQRRIFEYRVFGWFPWITDDHFDVSFWRPLASLTHLVDYSFYPERGQLMHLVNVVWYGACAAAVALLYRSLCTSPWIAGIAAILYAVDDAHGHAVGWLANRNGIMATTFGVLALLLFDRWRRGGSRTAGALVPPCLGAALLSAEFALSVVGYFVAYALFIDPAPWRRRVAATAPWLATIAAWVLMYRHLGHSAHGSGLYVNPVNEPAAFAVQFAERATVLIASAFGGPPADLWTYVDRADQGYVVYLAATLLLGVAWLLGPLIREKRAMRFWLTGAVLSVAPACAAFPEDRLLFFVGVGVMPIVASAFHAAREGAVLAWPRPRLRRMLMLALFAIHAVVAPALLPWRTLHMHRYDAEMQREGDALFSHVRDPATQSMILVNARDFYFAGMMPLLRVARAKPTITRLLTLAGTHSAVTIRRLDERTIEVAPEGGFLTRVFNSIYRGHSNPLQRGMRIDLLGVSVEVTEVDPWGAPLRATFEFALPLESPLYLWVAREDDAYVGFTPPRIGETVVVGGDR